VLGIVVEVQLSRDEDKRYVWPVYAVNLRARICCPVCLLAIAVDQVVAHWAGKTINLGGDSRFVPWVLGLSGVPEVRDEQEAKKDPELAVLSAMGHAQDPDTAKSVRIALLAQMASVGLDADRRTLYLDLILHSLPEAARRALKAINPMKYEYQSDFAREYFGKGKAAGRIELILKLLAGKYGTLSQAIESRIREVNNEELDSVAVRLLSARTVEEAVGIEMVEA
jgi:hypothetical protein